MQIFEMVEIGKLESTVNKAFVNFGRRSGYNPKMDLNTLRTYVTIANNKYVIGDYRVCKDGMILADLVKIK